MKKRIFALLLVMAMLLSCVFMLTSCPDDGPDNGGNTGDNGGNTGDNGGNTGDNGGTQGDGDLNLDESVDGGTLGGSTIITDPNDPEAGKNTENKYTPH